MAAWTCCSLHTGRIDDDREDITAQSLGTRSQQHAALALQARVSQQACEPARADQREKHMESLAKQTRSIRLYLIKAHPTTLPANLPGPHITSLLECKKGPRGTYRSQSFQHESAVGFRVRSSNRPTPTRGVYQKLAGVTQKPRVMRRPESSQHSAS